MANLHYRLTLWNQIMYECKRVLTGDVRGRVIREKCEWTRLSVLPDRLSYVSCFIEELWGSSRIRMMLILLFFLSKRVRGKGLDHGSYHSHTIISWELQNHKLRVISGKFSLVSTKNGLHLNRYAKTPHLPLIEVLYREEFVMIKVIIRREPFWKTDCSWFKCLL